MFHDTRPAQLDAGGAEDAWGEFRVNHPQERIALLRQLRDGQTPVVLSGPDGSTLSTTVWSVEPDHGRLAFDVNPGLPALHRLVEGDEAAAVTYMEAVKLQFDLHDIVLVHGASSATLQCALPQSMYRFQRRNAYRVRAPSRHGPVARLRHPSLPDMKLALRVLDVSLGGCALWLPANVPGLQPGTLIADVAVELDAQSRFSAGVRLQHVSALGGDSNGLRLGCEWHALAPPAERELQRWIDLMQRRRRVLARGSA
jgi:flagellar brake protein